MSTNAIGVLKIDPALVRTALPALKGEDVRRGADGEPLRIRALDNATLVYLDAPVTEDPDILGFGLAARLGELVAAHGEARGVPVYPESYSLAARTWDAAIEELGDGAEWIALPTAAPAFPDLNAMLAGGGPPQLAALAQQLQGEGGAAMLQQAMQMAQQLAQSGGLAELARKMSGATTPEAAFAQAGADPAALGGVDLSAMMAQAQSMLAANPDLERQLREQLGGMIGEEDGEDDGEDGE